MTDRNLRFALIVSLAVNIFLVGGAAGALGFWVLRPKAQIAEPSVRSGPARAQPARRALRFAADELAPAQRQQFRMALRQAWRDSAPAARRAREQRVALADLLAQPSPDRAKVDAAMAGARQADLAVRARVELAVADFAAGLSPEDRAVFLAGLKRSGGLLRVPATGNAAPPR
jgi:uncharacterized membrane protein